MKLTYEQWLRQLHAYAEQSGNPIKYTDEIGPDCWRGYYEDHYTPEDAYREDCSHD